MAQHIRKNPDGSVRVLSDEEAEAEGVAFMYIIAIAVCGFAAHWAASSLLGDLNNPFKKIAYVASIIGGIGIGAKFAAQLWAAALGAGVLWLLYHLGRWIFN